MDPLWEQIDLAYVRRTPPERRWKRWMSAGCALLAGGWAIAAAWRGDTRMFASGPMSRGHAHLEGNCGVCHVESWRTLRGSISARIDARSMNLACLRCHGATIGQDPMTASAAHHTHDDHAGSPAGTVACYECHAEHEGSHPLRDVPDSACVRCHRDLDAHRSAPVKGTEPGVIARSVTSFAADHPEFDVVAAKRPDGARMLLNHAKHLDPSAFPDHTQMRCDDCHRAGRSAAPWRFATIAPHQDSWIASTADEPDRRGAYMNPIRYSLHCQKCHALSVDALRNRLNGSGNVPHDTPQAIRTFLWGALARHAEAHPDALDEPENASGSHRSYFSEPRDSEVVDRRKLEWVRRESLRLEEQLYTKKILCRKCHDVTSPDAAASVEPGDLPPLPEIVPPNIPMRWLPRASFNHERHRTMNCDGCHPRAASSKETVDVLLPGVETCRACHAPPRGASPGGATPNGGVSDRCVLCHTYHLPNAGGDGREPQGPPPDRDRAGDAAGGASPRGARHEGERVVLGSTESPADAYDPRSGEARNP